jgi:hypothetical protein
MWFTEIAHHQNPGRDELSQFLQNVQQFLAFALEARELKFLWEDEPTLRPLAIETFQADVIPGIERLRRNVPEIMQERLMLHGLLGRPLQFKLRVLDSIGQQWDKVREQFSVREWLKRIFDAIDAILDCVIDAAGGVGGLVKEFKDALAALVKTA